MSLIRYSKGSTYLRLLLVLSLFFCGIGLGIFLRTDLRLTFIEAYADPVLGGEETELGPEEVMPQETEAPKFTPLNPRWSAPDFSGQDKSLGWNPDAFVPPRGMEERVQFWKDVYTKYTSDQGLLHDSVYVHLVYDSLDFADITIRSDLSSRQKEKLRRQRVDDKKKEVAARLTRLSSLPDSSGLTGEDLRFWEMFSKVEDKDKWQEAARKGRLRFQLGQRDIFIKGIYQSGRYLKQMEEIFRQEGLPIEITRLPFVESSFNLKARSRVGASGIWQFMRSTARLYMRVDTSADERNDPLLATRAAAKKMRDNYQMLKNWPLAITAYNHGPHGVKRLTEKLGTTDITELIDVRRGRFGFASASFFASFLAALDVERNADRHFGTLEIMPELRGAEIKLTRSQPMRELVKFFDGDLEKARTMNPHLAQRVWMGKQLLSARHTWRVPPTQETQARGNL